MANLHDIKRRIDSVTSTQKITRAMKMVAAAKLRRAQEAIEQARPYALRMRDVVNRLALRADMQEHALLRRGNADGPVRVIVVTADRGLCGAFNANVINRAQQIIQDRFAGRNVEVVVIGKKGSELLRRRKVNVLASHLNVPDGDVMEAAREIAGHAVESFVTGGTAEVHCVYNEFKSAISQQVVQERLLPFEPAARPGTGPVVDYVYEPSAEDVFAGLLERHLQVQLHRMIYESAAGEHGARMTAMDSATTNAGDMISRLTLQYNRARQDAITTELIEVVSGAEAL